MIIKLWLKRIILCLISFPVLSIFGQKHYTVAITLPNGLDVEKLEAYLDNGKSNVKIDAQVKGNHQVLYTGEFYSIYARLELQYKKGSDEASSVFFNIFFLNETPASIHFFRSDSALSPLENYSLQNVKDFKIEQQQMAYADSAERRVAREYFARYVEKIDSGKYPEIAKYYFNVLSKAQGRKKLEYILKNPNSYYSFYSFRRDVAWPLILPADSLIEILDSVFPDNFKFSDEGNYLKDYLYGRASNLEKGVPIDFSAKDINGKDVTLSQFKNQKNVLLHFWATWCSPCMREMALIKEIGKQYGQKDLQIISIASKSNRYSDFVEATKKYQMDWINIYNDRDLENKYGNRPVPRICVIDKTGKLVYDTFGLEKKEDSQLSLLNQVLRSLMK